MVTPSLCIYTCFHFIIVTGRRNQSHSNVLLSPSEKWWRALCAWSHEGNKRKSRRSTSSACVGWVPSQPYNTSLLFFSFPLLPLPRNGFPTEDKKAARRRGLSPVQVEGACHCQTSTRSRQCFGHATYISLSPSRTQQINCFLQDLDACNADVSIWPTCLCWCNSQCKDISSPICTIVLILK